MVIHTCPKCSKTNLKNIKLDLNDGKGTVVDGFHCVECGIVFAAKSE